MEKEDVDAEKSETREDAEEMVIDTEALKRYNRGEKINVKVKCSINRMIQEELL